MAAATSTAALIARSLTVDWIARPTHQCCTLFDSFGGRRVGGEEIYVISALFGQRVHLVLVHF